MAKVELRAGAKLDLLSPDEMDEALGPVRDLLGKIAEPTTTIRHSAPRIVVPTNGIITEAQLYRTPAGMEARINRITVTADGYTPGAPLTTAAAFLSFWRDAAATAYGFIVGLPAGSTAVLPATITDGHDAAPVLANGEILVLSGNLVGSGSPLANAIGLYVNLQISLRRIPPEEIVTD